MPYAKKIIGDYSYAISQLLIIFYIREILKKNGNTVNLFIDFKNAFVHLGGRPFIIF
jgi:hypothetical protein